MRSLIKGPRRVASRLNLAGLFKSPEKTFAKISLVASATPELQSFSRR